MVEAARKRQKSKKNNRRIGERTGIRDSGRKTVCDGTEKRSRRSEGSSETSIGVMLGTMRRLHTYKQARIVRIHVSSKIVFVFPPYPCKSKMLFFVVFAFVCC